MQRRKRNHRHVIATTSVVLSSLVSGCATQATRAVVSVVPDELSHSIEATSIESATSEEAPAEEFVLQSVAFDPEWSSTQDQADTQADYGFGSGAQGLMSLDLSQTLGSGMTQLDPELGPMDLGYPLLVDLGAGEAPYDDGVRTIHGVELTRGGFSDAVLTASWRETLTESSKLHATVAVTRFQDLGMLEGVDEMRFAWFVLGWKTSL